MYLVLKVTFNQYAGCSFLHKDKLEFPESKTAVAKCKVE